MKGKKHKEYYVNYIATREGVEKYKNDNENRKSTKKQKELIENMLQDFPESKDMFEYEDYVQHPTRSRASEFISTVIDQNINDLSNRENYVDYISHRPRVEKLGEHGLFTDDGISFRLQDVVKEIGEHQGNVWTHIISIKREDAQRLGYDHAESWMNLCQSHRNQIAEAMKIDPSNLKWYAAFHNEGHHPHIHMVVYSTDPKEGYLTQKGIEKIRHMFASDIFQNDLLHAYKKQTEKRDELKKYSREKIRDILDQVYSKQFDNVDIFRKIIELKKSLESYHGRLMYAYIPQNSKHIILDILRMMEAEPHIKELYDQWLLYQQDIQSTYDEKKYEKIPLFEQKEFRSLRNIILKEVNDFDDNRFMMNEVTEQDNDMMLFDVFDENDCQNFVDKSTQKDFIIEWSQDYKDAVQYFYGNEKQAQNIEMAEQLLKKECNRKNVLAYSLLGKLYSIKQNTDLADSLHLLALRGYKYLHEKEHQPFIKSYCSYRAGKQYLYGIGTEKNYEKAYQLLLKSDSCYAQYLLGVMYQRGLEVECNGSIAFDYFNKSADGGNIYGIYEVARHYDYGIGCRKDSEKADDYYRKAYTHFVRMIKESEDDNILYRLGMMTYTGKGCEKNIKQSIAYLEKSAALDNLNAKMLLARIYLDENDYENIPHAIEWLEKADNEQAHYLLGKEYHQGLHVDNDLEKAIYHLTQCQDNEHAYYRLARIYNEINDVEQEIKYLRQACDKNHDPALIRLSKLLIEGIKTEKNINQAIEYLKIADSHNNQFAQYMLGKLFLFGVDVQQNKDLAREYLIKSADQGNIHAQYLLEHMDDFYNQSLSIMTTRFFHHASRIIENELPVSNHIFYGEHKLKLKIRHKRSALGHKENDQTLRF